MPKRRGRAQARASPGPTSLPTGPLDRFFGTPRQESTTMWGSPGGGAGVMEEHSVSPGFDVTLSPDQRAPQPQRTSSPSEGTNPQPPKSVAEWISSEALIEDTVREPGGQISTLDGSSSTGMGLRGAEGGRGEGSSEHMNLPSGIIEKPSEVTLENLWDLVAQLAQFIKQQSVSFSNKLLLVEQRVEKNEGEIKSVVERLETTEKKVVEMGDLQTLILKDISNLRNKTELYDNYMKRYNLRFANFPKLKMTSPMDMLKRYLKEILEIPEENIPPFTQVFYIPQKAPDQQTSLDVSALLETSETEQAIPATLVVTVALLPDKQWLFRLFFRNKFKLFLGLKIILFPDISKVTQKKRKQFLILKPAVLQLGGTFYLRFPCKCIIIYKTVKYVFLEPSHLSSFVSSKGTSMQV